MFVDIKGSPSSVKPVEMKRRYTRARLILTPPALLAGCRVDNPEM